VPGNIEFFRRKSKIACSVVKRRLQKMAPCVFFALDRRKYMAFEAEGGAVGPRGHGRTLKPETEVNHLIEVRPDSCGQWGTLLLGEDPEPEERHQVTELPRLMPVVAEDGHHRLYCVVCGAISQAAWPATMRRVKPPLMAASA
jgi:hypothetical protein